MNISSLVDQYDFTIKLVDLKPILDDPTVQLILKTIGHLACVVVAFQKLVNMFASISITQFITRLISLYK